MKKSPLKRKTPLRRGNSQLKRSSLSRSNGKLSEVAQRREAYLRRFRGQPCAICGKTKWGNQRSTAHHILKAELFPEHYFTETNIIVLCPAHHVPFAHDQESEFLRWLWENRNDQALWVKEHRHHRKES